MTQIIQSVSEHGTTGQVVSEPRGRAELHTEPAEVRAYAGTEMLAAAFPRWAAEDVPGAIAKHGSIPGDANKLIRDCEVIIQSAPRIAADAIKAAERLRGDDTIADAGKQRLIAEQAEQVQAQLDEARRRADAHLDLAEANLTVTALPKLTKGAELTARSDAQMLIGDQKGDSRTHVMMDLAAGGDDVAALIAGPWGRQALAAGGLKGDDLTRAHKAVIAAAVAAAADADDDTRRTAARHIRTLGKLRGQRDAVGALGRNAAQEIRTRNKLADPIR
ncbi:MAG TPA: hypothetical protein VGI64_05980 [Streptosporangiaceae bacterium]|jgi:hypothetical protein